MDKHEMDELAEECHGYGVGRDYDGSWVVLKCATSPMTGQPVPGPIVARVASWDEGHGTAELLGGIRSCAVHPDTAGRFQADADV